MWIKIAAIAVVCVFTDDPIVLQVQILLVIQLEVVRMDEEAVLKTVGRETDL
jgi:hypothetical protein